MLEDEIEQIKRLLTTCSKEQRYEIFQILRQEFTIHPIENSLNVSAEIILEAISRASESMPPHLKPVFSASRSAFRQCD